jgi:hypothetical protein
VTGEFYHMACKQFVKVYLQRTNEYNLNEISHKYPSMSITISDTKVTQIERGDWSFKIIIDQNTVSLAHGTEQLDCWLASSR